jgi:hypothetical protein
VRPASFCSPIDRQRDPITNAVDQRMDVHIFVFDYQCFIACHPNHHATRFVLSTSIGAVFVE